MIKKLDNISESAVIQYEKSDYDNYVLFCEVKDINEIEKDVSKKNELLSQIKKIIHEQIGEIFTVDEILLFKELPKKMKNNVNVVDYYKLAQFLNLKNSDKIFNTAQEIYDFQNLYKTLNN